MSLPQQSSCVRRTRASASPLEAAEENAECAYKPVFSACLAAFQGPLAFGVIGIAYEPIGYHILRVEMIISALEAKIITNRAHDLTVMSPTCGSDGCVFEPTQVSRSGWGSSTSKVMSPICATPFSASLLLAVQPRPWPVGSARARESLPSLVRVCSELPTRRFSNCHSAPKSFLSYKRQVDTESHALARVRNTESTSNSCKNRDC